jgi:hypothetical protein
MSDEEGGESDEQNFRSILPGRWGRSSSRGRAWSWSAATSSASPAPAHGEDVCVWGGGKGGGGKGGGGKGWMGAKRDRERRGIGGRRGEKR